MPAGRLLVVSNCKTCCIVIMSMRFTKRLTFDIHTFKSIQNKIFAGELIIWDKAGPMVTRGPSRLRLSEFVQISEFFSIYKMTRCTTR